jgi:hypothetical protein
MIIFIVFCTGIMVLVVATWMARWRWTSCFLLLFGVLQGMSANYLLPVGFYKDGGDGSYTNDFWVWAIYSGFLVALLRLVEIGVRKYRRRQKPNA